MTDKEKLNIVQNALEIYLQLDMNDPEVRKNWEAFYLMPALDRLNNCLKNPMEYSKNGRF